MTRWPLTPRGTGAIVLAFAAFILAPAFGVPALLFFGVLLVAAVGLPVIGVVIVGLDIMPVRFAMMHVALLGIAVALLTGLDPMLCALVACALAGAGVAPLNHDTLWSWVRDPQVLKPGCFMPDMKLHDKEVDAIVAYLETLK